MKLKTLIAFLLLQSFAYGQKEALEFNKKYFECEDQWVAFPPSDDDPSYSLGFIYLDEQAGFTFQNEGEFNILSSGTFGKVRKVGDYNIKIRLSPDIRLVAIIPPGKLKELGLPVAPDWLSVYHESTDSIASLVKRGFHYNHAGASQIALTFLEKAYQYDKHKNGLEFELAYAYNATKQHNRAAEVLQSAIAHDPKNYLFYRELGYSLIRLNRIEEAEEAYTKGIELSDSKYQKSEMAINMAQAYSQAKNKEKFKKWAKLTKKYCDKDSPFLGYLKQFKKAMNE